MELMTLKYIIYGFMVGFIMIFITLITIQNQNKNTQLALFINGYIANEEIEELRIGVSRTQGIWENKEESKFKFILYRMRSQEVVMATNEVDEIKEYIKIN